MILRPKRREAADLLLLTPYDLAGFRYSGRN